MKIHTYIGAILVVMILTHSTVKSFDLPGEASITDELGIRPLIILFDPNNEDGYKRGKETGAMRTTLRTSLGSYYIPIITSRWLLDFAMEDSETKKKLQYWDIYLANNPAAQSMVVFIPKKGILDPTEEAGTKVPLIPYAEKLNTYSVSETKALSDGELLLGIKINKLQKVDLSSISADNETPSDDLKKFLQDILITHADTKKLSANSDNDFLNLWDILLFGHGLAGKTIAGMTTASFTSVLDFLNFGIHTRSLFYISCYSGGTNLEKAYRYTTHMDEKEHKNFNFMIIVLNAFETVTFTGLPSKGMIDYFQMLNAYITNQNPPSLLQVVKNISGDESVKSSFSKEKKELQLPVVRFPHTQWFNIVEASKIPIIKSDIRKLRITDDLIQQVMNNSDEKKIVIPQGVYSIEFESRYIPIPIVFKSRKDSPFVSTEKGKDYFIEEIDARECELIGGGRSIFTVMQNFGPFYIKKLITKGDPNPDIQSSEITANTFDNVRIGESRVDVDFKGNHFEYANKRWGSATANRFYLPEKIEAIRNASALPESMKSGQEALQGTKMIRITNSSIQRIINGGKDKINIPADVKLIVVEARYVPIPVVISGNEMPLIVPLESNKNYFFAEIDASQCVFSEKGKGLLDMFDALNEKMPNAGSFFIQKLIISAGSDRSITTYVQAKWLPIPILNEVTIDPSGALSYITEKGVCAMGIASRHLTRNFDSDARTTARATYLDEIEKIRKESKLPESMKSENPKPVIAIGSAQESGKRKITGSANE